jgi:hypothetical protein
MTNIPIRTIFIININTQTHSFKSTSNTVHRSQTFPCEITEIADKPFNFDGFEAQ